MHRKIGSLFLQYVVKRKLWKILRFGIRWKLQLRSSDSGCSLKKEYHLQKKNVRKVLMARESLFAQRHSGGHSRPFFACIFPLFANISHPFFIFPATLVRFWEWCHLYCKIKVLFWLWLSRSTNGTWENLSFPGHCPLLGISSSLHKWWRLLSQSGVPATTVLYQVLK